MITRVTILLAATSTMLAALAMPAAARAEQCAARAQALASLTERHGETRRGIGLESRGTVVEVFAAEAGGWTILVTRPDGTSCVVASGTGYEDLAEALPPQA